MPKTKTELFLELAQPDEEGRSRWVNVSEFIEKYKELKLGNGGSWCRKESTLAKKYLLEFDKSQTSGNSIDAIRTIGLNKKDCFNQTIRNDIKEHYRNKNCVMLGIKGNSENTKIEIDHKDGRKNNARVSDLATQRLEDFQPLTKAANDAKRQICKKCMETGKRWDARNLDGNPVAYYKGGESLEDFGCEGCYQYDPVEYRKEIIKKARNGEI
ncbi:MAG: restriction endonuclease [Alphaproteobacteria bacterium]|nr:restriction endonuclease [Alphaproteobacteria bacterium]